MKMSDIPFGTTDWSSVERNAVSPDGRWRLANLHRELGERARAIECYRTCLEIIPDMRPAREWVEKLEKGE